MEHRAEGCTSPFGTGSRSLLRRLKEEGSYGLEHFWILLPLLLAQAYWVGEKMAPAFFLVLPVDL